MVDKYYIRKKYLATEDEVERLLDQQYCEICGKVLEEKRSAIDHNHDTGKIRGRLCHYCNRQVVGGIESAARYRGMTTKEFLGKINDYFLKYS